MKIAYVVRKDCPRCVNILERIDRILPNDWERVYENGLEGITMGLILRVTGAR